MCLIVSSPRKLKVDKDGFCTGWKLLVGDNSSPYFNGRVKYRVGEVRSERKSPKLTSTEKDNNVVFYGIHIYQTRADARVGVKTYLDYYRECENVSKKLKIIKVYFKKEDIVAFGHPDPMFFQTKNIIVTKLTIKSLDRAN